MSKVRLIDIARKCGVSTATVQRVIRSSGYVSDEKRKQIQSAITDMGYIPKQVSPFADLPEAKLIAYFAPSETHLLFGQLLDAICRVAKTNGYSIITEHIQEGQSPLDISHAIEALRMYQIRGVILSALGDAIDFRGINRYLQMLPIPVVMVERAADIFNVNKVLINAREGIYIAVQHLVAAGHRHICMFSEKTSAEVETSRMDGFISASKMFGIEHSASLIPTDDYSFGEGYKALAQYLKEHRLPTAIIASDSLLVGMMQYLYEHTIRVPDTVSLVGIDNTYAGMLAPKVTSIAFPVEEISKMTVQLILDESGKRDNSVAKEILLSPYIVERASVASPRRDDI